MLGNADACVTIAVKDLDAAREFYEETLGLEVDKEFSDAPMVLYRSGNSRIQVYMSEQAGSNKATYATWELGGQVAAAVETLKSRGVEFHHYPDIPETALEGDIHTWGNEQAAWFSDPDGNILCLHGTKS